MEGDRQTCLAAGMDDFISKPVRLEAVSEVLRRWVSAAATDSDRAPTDGRADPARDPQSRSRRPARPHADRAPAAVSTAAKGETLGEIVQQYLAPRREGPASSCAGCSPRATSLSLERAAHTLKGASANVGASAMVEVCAALETLGPDRGAR